ncbi:tRNA (adenine(22)-N(1))-methyltransferase [Clostridium cadaveris]|uniref:tRNA (adenine(22)-N(1))-methyltransferase n=1 Tax=Clostridium cadaveris TaxID=1529 RepID=UPI0039920686
MELSIRLKTISNLVDKCHAIVDVGTDHGYMPIYLTEKALCDKAIASDINRGPVDKAKKNVSLHGMKDKVECRLGPGLTTVKKGEVQGAVIAGMGGNLIRDIILQSYDIFKELDFAVLQPSQNPEVLRKFLYEEGITILEEDLCLDEGIYYEVMKVKFEGNSPVSIPEVYYEVSSSLLKSGNVHMKDYLMEKIDNNKKILSKIQDVTENALEKKKKVERKIKELEELTTWL